MQTAPSPLRTIYRWIAFLSLPGVFWAAFEMYGLTLGGSQMLFYSIVHTMPPLILAVVLSLPLGLAWLIQSVVALLNERYADKLQIPRSAHRTFATMLIAYGFALVGYETWSEWPLRIPLCLLGLALTGRGANQAWQHLRRSAGSELG